MTETTEDLTRSYEGKREGQARAASASSEWIAMAKEVAIRRAVDGEEFTAQDITNEVGFPESAGAVGTLFSHLARSKQIEWTGEIRPCSREQAHASDMRVWRVYTGLAERRAAVLARVEEFMEIPDGSSLTRAERQPGLFARQIRLAWES